MAIVAVDVVGYSRLMADDEDGTLAALRDLRALIDPIFEANGGRIVKSTGDGVLVEAPSVIAATRASIEAQGAVREWNLRRTEPMLLRIGINLGDVVVDDTGDIYGDGVNVAARLEGLADPGGICISDAAYQQIRGRIAAPMTDRGAQQVKNIPRPIRVWSIDLEGGPGPRRTRRRVLVPTIGLLAIVLVAGGSAVLLRGDDAPPGTTTTTTPEVDDRVAIESAAWVEAFDGPIDMVVADDGVVVVALESGDIHALSATGGSEAWQTPAGDAISSLAADAGLVVFMTEGSRVVHALDGAGTEDWRHIVDLEGAQAIPLLDLTAEGVFVAYGFGATRLDRAGGDELWIEPLAANLNIDAVSAGTTALALGDGRFVHGLDPSDGGDLWPAVGPPTVSGGVVWVRVWEVEIDGPFTSELVSRILVLTGEQDLVALDGQTGREVWHVEVTGTPALAGDTLFVADVDGRLAALEADGGDVSWPRDDLEPSWPPVVDGDTLFVIVGSELLVLNPRSGSTRARIDLGSEPTGPPVVVAGGVVVIPFGSTLAAFQPDA